MKIDNNRGLTLLLIFTVGLVSIIISLSMKVKAGYSEPTTTTNINKIDPLFQKSVEDYQSFKQQIENSKETNKSGIEGNIGFDSLPGNDKAQTEATRLSNIHEGNLNAQGRAEMAKDPFYNEMFVDYTKPGMMAHKQDAELIANATGNLMNNLLGNLKNLGVDCKTVKGNKEMEPQYFIEIDRREDRSKGDTIYDQFFCERLRNNYSCIDALIINCKTKGSVWGVWQDRSINYYNIPDSWLKVVSAADGYGYIWYMKNDMQIMPEVRVAIANRVNANLDQIDTWIDISEKGEGKFHTWKVGQVDSGKNHGTGSTSVISYGRWEYHVFKYKYRESLPACLEWQENWQETCRAE